MKTIFNIIAIASVMTACGTYGTGYPVAGPAGKDGSNGLPGAQGPQGVPGTPGTQITVVQLCPNNSVSTYPSVFSEVAFCIGGSLFAVYSQNDGFESEIPPGTYTSNGINSACSFTVQPNCVVTQQ